MALPARETLSPLAHIHNEIDRMFQDFGGTKLWPWHDATRRYPALDVFEEDGNLVVEAELPGISKEDLEVSYAENTVTIHGQTKQETEEKKEGYYRIERQCGAYYRAVPLPHLVDFAKAKAELKDGVLTITLPKTEKPSEQKPKIPITG